MAPGVVFGAFWVAKRSQVASKIVPKIDLGGVLGGLGGLLAAKTETERGPPVLGGQLGAVLGAVLGASWAVLASKMEPKSKKIGSWRQVGIKMAS